MGYSRKVIFSIFVIALFGSATLAFAVFVDSFDLSGDIVIPKSVEFNTDGTKMFVLDNSGGVGGTSPDPRVARRGY